MESTICHLIHRKNKRGWWFPLPLHHTVLVWMKWDLKVFLFVTEKLHRPCSLLLIITEDRTTGHLTFTEKLHTMRVSVQSLYFSIWLFFLLLHYSSWFLWAGLAEVYFPPGTGLLCWVLHQPGLGKHAGTTFISWLAVKPSILLVWAVWSWNVTHCEMHFNIVPFPDGTPVFPQLFPVPCRAISLVS